MKLTINPNLKEVIVKGTKLKFKDEYYEFEYASRAREPGRTGKVVVKDILGNEYEYYDTVFNIAVIETSEPYFISDKVKFAYEYIIRKTFQK